MFLFIYPYTWIPWNLFKSFFELFKDGIGMDFWAWAYVYFLFISLLVSCPIEQAEAEATAELLLAALFLLAER